MRGSSDAQKEQRFDVPLAARHIRQWRGSNWSSIRLTRLFTVVPNLALQSAIHLSEI